MGQKLIEVLTSGEIGELLMWEWVQHLEADPAKGAMRYDTTPWRKAGNFPLGTLFDGGIHLIAGLSQVFGVPETVSASGKQLRPEYGEYDHVVMIFQYGNGVTGVLSHSSYLPPLQNHFYVYGTQGVITVAWERLVVKKQDQSERVIELPSENAYQNMWRALARAFEEGKEPYYTSERALADVAILETVDKAIKAGQRLRIIQ
jgi:predicted dehydrogenase